MESKYSSSSSSSLHIAMFPWFAFGHITPFLNFANKLAKKGHQVSFLIPTKTQSKVQHFNNFPHLITFVPVDVPHVDGLPHGAETTADVPAPLIPLIMTAMDRTESHVDALLRRLKPQVILFDFALWIPNLSRPLGIKSVHYSTTSAVAIAYSLSPARYQDRRELNEVDWMNPPCGFPDSSAIKISRHEARALLWVRNMKFCGEVLFFDHVFRSLSYCDALAFKDYRGIEGPFLEYLEREFGKPLLLSGPVLPERPVSSLEERWASWLGTFKAGSVIYCAFGSEVTLSKDQLQEILSGLELSGFPFVATVRPPVGCESVREAFPEGFEEKVGGRGIVHQGWIQQQLILEHPSVGCFVTHCGWGSLSEALVYGCELVLMPFIGDQIFNARLIANGLKAGVEVQRDEDDGSFTRESVCGAIQAVMDGGESGRDVRANRAKLTELFLREDLESSYVDEFSRSLCKLISE